MREHRFTLILTGVAGITAELADALCEATQGDIEFGMRDGVAFLEFERSASSLRDAVLSAIREVEETNTGIRVIRVESDTTID